MLKRCVEFVIASVLLSLSAPLLLIIAIALGSEGAGPILYGDLRRGKGGRLFKLWRFRTVDPAQPAHLPMHKRLTRVGRFIREHSLDDLPNMVNVVTGDVSFIGPRPTGPARVDLADPTWQKILRIRPGLVSPAILELTYRYNRSPLSVKQELELAYVNGQSLATDLRLASRYLCSFVASRGNVKARGKPSTALRYSTFDNDPTRPTHGTSIPAWNDPNGEQTHRAYVADFIAATDEAWEPDRPQLVLIPCELGSVRPAILLNVTRAEALPRLEFMGARWSTVHSSRYVCLGLTLAFASRDQHAQTKAVDGMVDSGHGREASWVYSNVFDVAEPAIDAWFHALLQLEGQPMLCVFATHPRTLQFWIVPAAQKTAKAYAIEQWHTAQTRLREQKFALENFATERAFLRRQLTQYDS